MIYWLVLLISVRLSAKGIDIFMLELLAPAGSPEAVVAAVQNGADSVYLGFGEYNARRNAENFNEEDLAKASEYCRIRGVKIYMTLNTLATDRELIQIERLAKKANRVGVDAILVQDLGAMRAIKQAVPDMPIHASTQMSVHNLDGVRMAAELGVSRVVLARELSKAHIAYICKNSPIEIEVFIHGALCMSYSGQCYMSAVIGQRSGNRGLCAQPCRLGYSLDGVAGNPLSLKDYCLAYDLEDLKKCGVTCLKIEGRMKRPEYTGIVTRVYAEALRENRKPNDEEMHLLTMAFSRQGFTNAYFQGQKGRDMLGIRTEDNKKEFAFFGQVRRDYLRGEHPRVPLKFYFIAKYGHPAMLAAEDDLGNIARAQGVFPQKAINLELDKEELEERLRKTGGTFYYAKSVDCAIEGGLNIPVSEINQMRRAALDRITELRAKFSPKREGIYRAGAQRENKEQLPGLNIYLSDLAQLSDDLLALKPDIVYMPIELIASGGKKIEPLLSHDRCLVAALPRVITDDQRDKMAQYIKKIRQIGITQVLTGNIGQIRTAQNEGFEVRGDFGLNVFNSQALKTLKNLELESATVSFELNLPQIRDMSKSIDTELIAYGRLPLMVTENCIIKNTKGRCLCDRSMSLSDRKGAAFPVVREFGCRNVVLNSKKLFVADRLPHFSSLGLWALRLMFTTENARECYAVTRRYKDEGYYEPSGFTRGLYYRGVE